MDILCNVYAHIFVFMYTQRFIPVYIHIIFLNCFEKDRETNINLFHLFLHSLVDSCM